MRNHLTGMMECHYIEVDVLLWMVHVSAGMAT